MRGTMQGYPYSAQGKQGPNPKYMELKYKFFFL